MSQAQPNQCSTSLWSYCQCTTAHAQPCLGYLSNSITCKRLTKLMPFTPQTVVNGVNVLVACAAHCRSCTAGSAQEANIDTGVSKALVVGQVQPSTGQRPCQLTRAAQVLHRRYASYSGSLQGMQLVATDALEGAPLSCGHAAAAARRGLMFTLNPFTREGVRYLTDMSHLYVGSVSRRHRHLAYFKVTHGSSCSGHAAMYPFLVSPNDRAVP